MLQEGKVMYIWLCLDQRLCDLICMTLCVPAVFSPLFEVVCQVHLQTVNLIGIPSKLCVKGCVGLVCEGVPMSADALKWAKCYLFKLSLMLFRLKARPLQSPLH